ncbi:two-component system, unclassified family, response regulator [Pseudoalteromonas sp. BSi20311]|jgi:two-component system response regulator|uniref:response regulator n=1 Tax=unclassified Pseudoalteromonas TaxID=194690 RepID=UPI0002317164|nr:MULTISPECIES: response regulator [unclassified Pseudoalteromonas]QBJ62145.1 response regulator [Pseudoalteromonas sp. DL-6]GAA64027.1 two-component system, unclassified family, response regulator [Pseudoalteromonas sp. BSi20311]GAA72172.1 two-component system, unclassified family, response regulator [Pseudoalteromonas sp. BSi20439]HCP97593.1 response regulator [Pseudoalteromonas sp.]|tara:strand:- start:408 stop:869 length:462 start_codon:yes stop_codon:yes gene_type:complete
MPLTTVKPITILMADDDEDDRLLTQDALAESRVLNELHFVEDGVELLEYLERKGKFEDKSISPRPGLILLDLNMPRMDGREALQAIKAHPNLKGIPVVILTTSKQEEDMVKGYNLGAASYITKPVTFDGLVELMKTLGKYWVEFVELPSTFND